MQHTPDTVREFFSLSDHLDYMVLRPLSHIAPNWEAIWDRVQRCYTSEPDSYADDLNWLIEQVALCKRPSRYHDNEDAIVKMLERAEWPQQKPNGHWVTADYRHLLERGAFHDFGQQNLISAAAGRVHAALDRGQSEFDVMETGHMNILAAIMTIAIYHRDNHGSSLRYEDEDEAE